MYFQMAVIVIAEYMYLYIFPKGCYSHLANTWICIYSQRTVIAITEHVFVFILPLIEIFKFD